MEPSSLDPAHVIMLRARLYTSEHRHYDGVYVQGAPRIHPERLIALRARARLQVLGDYWTADRVASLARKGSRIRDWWERAGTILKKGETA